MIKLNQIQQYGHSLTHSAIIYTYSVPGTKPGATDTVRDMVPVLRSLKSR